MLRPVIKECEGGYQLGITSEGLTVLHNSDFLITNGHRGLAYLEGLSLSPHLRYLEIATGMGPIPEYLVEKIRPFRKPVIIDPINYALIATLCARIKDRAGEISESAQEIVLRMQRRAILYSDPRFITHIPYPLQEAVQRHPELVGQFDVVMDFFGAIYYGRENRTQTVDLEKSLLSLTGSGIHCLQ